jgi:murein DD-endopeptidase MepM/ murein hydrolase activator NlpD
MKIKNVNVTTIVFVLLTYSCFAQNYSEFEIISKKDSLSCYLVVYNKTPSSVTLKLSLKEKNQIYQKHIIASLDSLIILKEESSNKENYLKEINDTYQLSYNFGDSLTSKHNNAYLYNFPFKKRKRYKLIQGWGGKFSHNNPKSFHALDFKMNIGEPVHAARAGIVVRSIDKYTKNGGRELRNFANTIILKHEDNTFAYYVHLKPGGSLVKVGQKIEKGELIGYSGNTGFSTSPHLHFVVRDGNANSVPFYFKGYKNKKLKPYKKYKN